MSKRRTYDKEFKMMVVNLVLSGKKAVRVAEEMDLESGLVRRWVREHKMYGDNGFKGNGVPVRTDAEEQIAKLQRELREVQMERDILKKAVSIFSKSDS